MDIKSAQQDVQTTFLRGSIGQAVAGLIWLASACLATWGNERLAMLVLVLAGVAIFPLTQLVLRLLGRPGGLPAGHPMNQLAMQVAFIVPFSLPLVGAASLYHLNWFYPAFMLVVGAHYLPFVFLYGMWEFAVLSFVLIGGGVAIGLLWPEVFSPGGWVTALALLSFAWLVRSKPGSASNGVASNSL